MAVLNRNAIISGKDNVETFHFDKLDGELRLRPLNDFELQKVTARMKSEGIGTVNAKPVMKNGTVDKDATMDNIDMEFNVETAQMAAYSASCFAITLSLDNKDNSDEEKFTEDELKEFPAGSVDEIASKVFEISGVDDPNPERMQKFRSGE